MKIINTWFLVTIYLIFSSGSVYSGEWTSKHSNSGAPKFGDYLKRNNGVVRQISSNKNTKPKKGNPKKQ